MRSNFMTKNHTHIYWDRSSDYVPLHQKDCQLSQFQCQQQSKSLLATWQLIIFGGFCKPNFQFTWKCFAFTQKQNSKWNIKAHRVLRWVVIPDFFTIAWWDLHFLVEIGHGIHGLHLFFKYFKWGLIFWPYYFW